MNRRYISQTFIFYKRFLDSTSELDHEHDFAHLLADILFIFRIIVYMLYARYTLCC